MSHSITDTTATKKAAEIAINPHCVSTKKLAIRKSVEKKLNKPDAGYRTPSGSEGKSTFFTDRSRPSLNANLVF